MISLLAKKRRTILEKLFRTGKSRIALVCGILTAFALLAIVPAMAQQTPIVASAYTPATDILAVSNPCGWWWGCKTNNYDSLILQYSSTWKLPDPMVIKAQIALESGFNTNAKGWNSYCKSYDEGLMQINPTCNHLNAQYLFYAWYNIDHGAAIWSSNYQYLVSKWGSGCSLKNRVLGALEMYNQGPGGVGSYCGSFPHGTTYAYAVLNDYYYPFCKYAGYKPRF
jgi:soluble lytic murein transglycosylase-like protein